MVKPRRRTDVDPAEEERIAAFAAQAEQPAKPVVRAVPDLKPEPAPLPQPAAAAADPDETDDSADDDSDEVSRPAAAKAKARRKSVPSPSDSSSFDAPWKRRNREKKTTGLNFRASESQMELLKQASIHEEISQQKVLERLVWPILEERYGKGSSS